MKPDTFDSSSAVFELNLSVVCLLRKFLNILSLIINSSQITTSESIIVVFGGMGLFQCAI